VPGRRRLPRLEARPFRVGRPGAGAQQSQLRPPERRLRLKPQAVGGDATRIGGRRRSHTRP